MSTGSETPSLLGYRASGSTASSGKASKDIKRRDLMIRSLQRCTGYVSMDKLSLLSSWTLDSGGLSFCLNK